MKRPICPHCGDECAPGTLMAHVAAAHPKGAPAKKRPATCRAAKCVDVYGPAGHVPGIDGPHAY